MLQWPVLEMSMIIKLKYTVELRGLEYHT